MGHSIPVYFLVCEAFEIPSPLETWNDIGPLLMQAHENPALYRLHSATARNWWQILAITEIRDREDLPGLSFCDRDVSVLTQSELPETISSLRAVIRVREELGQMDGEEAAEVLPNVEIDCEIPDGLRQFLTALLNVLEAALAERKAFVFIQPQP